MPRYDPEWLGIGFGHVEGVGKSAAIREGSGVVNKRKHTRPSKLYKGMAHTQQIRHTCYI